MADNSTLPGTGEVYASDDIGGVKHQRCKMSVGPAGTAVDLSAAAPMPVLDQMLELSRGSVTGHSCINKFGANLAIASATTEDIWDGGGTYPFPTTADITHIVQAVDQVAMRGANIEVQGLDINWALVTQTKALNAANTTTAVALDTALLRVFRMRVNADVVGDQDIHVQNVGAGTQYATMLAGNNQTLMAIYTVPAGKTAFITNYFADTLVVTAKDPKSVNFRLWVADRANSYEFQLKHAQGINEAGTGITHVFAPYLVVTEKSDIKITAMPADKEVSAHAGFALILVDN
ncbi:hypothetical protein LCGC14_1012520 [marine sediment metagenome]|uniref:Uncharacterized protein n=1 Tax=marine sediment metagenome TaxID=412755 RepID=A0A0F9QI71_9ZZZZ